MPEPAGRTGRSVIRMASRRSFDAFVSYSHEEPDRTWVRERLVPALDLHQVAVFADYRHFRLGQPIITEIERAVDQSRFTLAVLSPPYLRSTFAQLESVLAEHVGLEEGSRRLIGILRRQCHPRLSIRARLWLDMTIDDQFESRIERLVREIREPI
jgi:hypothetical protein